MAIVEPEVVWHQSCHWQRPDPNPPEDGEAVPVMALIKTLDDAAGHQRVYRCPRCESEVSVNFPPTKGCGVIRAKHGVRGPWVICRPSDRTYWNRGLWGALAAAERMAKEPAFTLERQLTDHGLTVYATKQPKDAV